MSTNWYPLKKPFTGVRVEPREGGMMLDLIIWCNHARSGSLILHKDELSSVLSSLMDWNRPVVHEAFGGPDVGKITRWVEKDDSNFDGQVINAYLDRYARVNRDDYNLGSARSIGDNYG